MIAIINFLRFNNLRGDIIVGVMAAVVLFALAFRVVFEVGSLGGLCGAICAGFFGALFSGTLPCLVGYQSCSLNRLG